MVVDYFTKWVEAEALANITKANTFKFIWENIIHWSEVPNSTIPDNGIQLI